MTEMLFRQRGSSRSLRAVQLATSHWRALPDFIVIGANKGGTTSMLTYLASHPLVVPCRTKEINYFDRPWNHDRGERWYRSWFPTKAALRRRASDEGADRAFTGEATPGYFDVEQVPRLVHDTVPEVRLIALLRDPTERAWSHYRMRTKGAGDPDQFLEALERQAAVGVGPHRPIRGEPGVDNLYLYRGHYADILGDWYAAFPAEQILLVRSEDMFSAPAEVYQRVTAHIGLPERGLPAFRVANQSRGEPEVPARLRTWLDDYYAEPNQRLAAMTGGVIVWPRGAGAGQRSRSTSS
jgi:hypothetical protein